MHTYKLYVTDMTKAYNTLTDAGHECEPKNTYLQVKAEENYKLDIIKKLTLHISLCLILSDKMHGSSWILQ